MSLRNSYFWLLLPTIFSASFLFSGGKIFANGTLIPFETPPTPSVNWFPAYGDKLIVDTQNNNGYLVHLSGDYTEFPLITGQRRVVRYIGRIYEATTPNRLWTVKSIEKKGDRITFGQDGRFLRLYFNNEETSYGIHGHAYFDKMLSSGDRFKSMGCIIVSYSMLDTLQTTYELNGGELPVVTVFGLENDIVTYFRNFNWFGKKDL